MITMKCLKCGYEWEGKKEKPKSCPKCKRYDWNKEDAPNGPKET